MEFDTENQVLLYLFLYHHSKYYKLSRTTNHWPSNWPLVNETGFVGEKVVNLGTGILASKGRCPMGGATLVKITVNNEDRTLPHLATVRFSARNNNKGA